jgi:hypothetical protein
MAVMRNPNTPTKILLDSLYYAYEDSPSKTDEWLENLALNPVLDLWELSHTHPMINEWHEDWRVYLVTRPYLPKRIADILRIHDPSKRVQAALARAEVLTQSCTNGLKN